MSTSDKVYLSKSDIFLVGILILFSGNPFLAGFQWLNVLFAIAFGSYWMVKAKRNGGLNQLWVYLLGVCMIFLMQTIIFMWNSFPAIVNFCCKIFWGGSICIILGWRFRYAYLKVITFLSLCSLVVWLLSLVHIIIPGLPWGRGSTIILYTYLFDQYTGALSIRNCGYPWEPGAFGCYLVLTFILFINSLSQLWKNYRKSCIIIFIAILTTMSTTAYMALAILLCSYLILKAKSSSKYILLLLLVGVSLYAWQNVEFLSDKFMAQADSAMASDGKFNSTRVGSLLFDMHYIEKHPLVGNGLHSKTRYEDHQYLVSLWEQGSLAYSGNGISGIMASMGILYFILFIYIMTSRNKKTLSPNDKLLIFIGIVLLLFGEPLLNYSLFLSLPMIKYT